LNGLSLQRSCKKAIEELEKINEGYGKRITVCVMLFSLVKDIGRTVPSVLCEWIAANDAVHLPIVLPEVEKYLPTEDGLPL
jgi:leucyl-tRNA synthetase